MATAEKKPLDTAVLQQISLERDIDRPFRITIGNKIGLRELSKFAHDKAEEEEEIVDQVRELDLFYEETLVAADRAAKAVWGYRLDKAPINPFTGSKMPTPTLEVPTGYGVAVPIAVGWFTLPGVEGLFSVQRRPAGMAILRAQVRRKNVGIFEQLVENTIKQARTNPLYSGSFVEFVESKDDDGDVIPGEPAAPVFLPIPHVNRQDLVLPEVVLDNIETVLFNPIEKLDLWRQLREKPSTKIVLAGPYGCGKSLTAAIAVRLACEAGMTVVQIRLENLREPAAILEYAIQFCRKKSPALLQVEDIDTLLSGERDAEMNLVMNTLSGVSGSDHEVIVLATTNHPETIHAMALRPGRTDHLIEMTPPDAFAASKLVEVYARGHLSESTVLSDVGRAFAGHMPATIEVATTWARQRAGFRTGDPHAKIGTNDLLFVAEQMRRHIELLNRKPEVEPSPVAVLAAGMVDAAKVVVGMPAPAPTPTPHAIPAKTKAVNDEDDLLDEFYTY